MKQSGETEGIIRLKQISPVARQHINFLRRYEFEKPENPIDLDEIVILIDPFRGVGRKIRFPKF